MTLRPPPPRTPDEWAEQHRVLPPWSAEPGPYRCTRTPWVPGILAACADPRFREIVAVMASQCAKTETDLNLIGQRMEDDPVPTIVVFPTENAAQSQFEPRLMDMLRSTPSLWAKTAQGKKNRKTAKLIGGVMLRLAWAGSATELASQPAGLVIVDELDRMEPVPGEGDVVQLVKARGTTYPDRKLVITSTPLVGTVDTVRHEATGLEHWRVTAPDEIESATWRRWQEGTRHEWAWPCTECNAYFIPRFRWLRWPKGATATEARLTARLQCPWCDATLEDGRKTEMNLRGVFLAPGQSVGEDGTIMGDLAPTETASFWISGLCSPWRTFGEIAQEYVKATALGDPAVMQSVVNTVLGELYSLAGEALPWETLRALQQPYQSGTVPDGVRVVVCGVDVQHNRLIYDVRGFGMRLESWLIQHGELWGETDQEAVWAELGALLLSTFDGWPIRLMLIDSGFRPQPVYDFCRRSQGRGRATKGWERSEKPYRAATIDVTVAGKTVKRGLQLWHLDAGFFKAFVHGRFGWPAGEPGGFHLPEDVPDAYLQELTAERRIVKPSGRPTWLRIRKANHGLDTAALTVAAAYMLHVDRLRVDTPLPPRPTALTPVAAAVAQAVETIRSRPVRFQFQR